jgi:hypothetical protein
MVTGSFYQLDTFGLDPYDPTTYNVTLNLKNAKTKFNFSEDVIGMIHVGAKRTDKIGLDSPGTFNDDESSHRGENYAKVDIDEDYAGEYLLERNISFVSNGDNFALHAHSVDWLPWVRMEKGRRISD